MNWPKNINRLKKTELKHFYKIKEEISFDDNLVYFNNKIVIPKSLRPMFIKTLHGHELDMN